MADVSGLTAHDLISHYRRPHDDDLRNYDRST